jgi:capsular exopolysaccharide synthesis family protein
VLGVFVAATFVSVLYSYMATPIYRSEAVLEAEKDAGMSINTIGDALASGLSGGTDPEFFATQIGILKNRTLSETLLVRMNLEDSPEFKGKPGFISTIIGSVKSFIGSFFASEQKEDQKEQEGIAQREGLIGAIRGRISAKRDGQGRLLNVWMEAKSPEFAQEMLKNFIDIYLLQNLDKRRRVNREAGSWLSDELKQTEDKLINSLGTLVNFTTKHGVVSIGEASNHILAFFNKAAEGLVKSKEFRIQIEALKRDGGEGALSMGTGIKPPETEALFGKISSLESEYAQMSEIYSENYPKMLMLKKQIEFVRTMIVEKQAKAVKAVALTAKEQEHLSEEAFEAAKKEALDNSELGVQYAVLKKDAETNEEIFRVLLKKAKELQLNTQIIGNNILSVVPATRPVGPVRPRKSLNLLIGCVLGLVGGIMAAMLAEHLDSSVKDSRELERMNLVNLGMVPNGKKLGRRRSRRKIPEEKVIPELQCYYKPTSAMAESLSIIKTSLFLMNPGQSLRSILITSAVPGEGKTFIAISLASTIVSGDKKVLIVDGDLRKPRTSKVFGLKYGLPGLSTLLTNPEASLEQTIYETPVAGMSLMPSGPLPENPVQLLETDHLVALVARLKEMFDLVVLDSPPVVGFSDARLISRAVDGTILVVKQAHASLELVRTAGSILAVPGGAKLLGSVFNNVESSSSRYSYYGNCHYYQYYDYQKYYKQA